MTYWLRQWVAGWTSERQIGWASVWLIGRVWASVWLIERVWANGWASVWLIEQVCGWLSEFERMVERVCGWLSKCMADWASLSEWLSECVADWASLSEWLSECVADWASLSEWLGECEWMTHLTSDWLNCWVDGWSCERLMWQWISGWTSESPARLVMTEQGSVWLKGADADWTNMGMIQWMNIMGYWVFDRMSDRSSVRAVDWTSDWWK
jgi:hypothetical protein